MYRILIHLSVLSLLEILFYFNYVGPLETKIFKESFHNSEIPDQDQTYVYNNITIDLNNNQEINNITDLYKQKSYIAEKNRNKHNNELYNTIINYWFILFGLTILACIIKIILKYKVFKFNKKKKTDNNFDEIEMTPISSLNSMEDAVLINNDRKRKKICNKDNLYFVLGKSIFYILLFGSIIFFEYLFFQHVVLNYHIISKAELELLIIETYLPVISEIVIDSYLN